MNGASTHKVLPQNWLGVSHSVTGSHEAFNNIYPNHYYSLTENTQDWLTHDQQGFVHSPRSDALQQSMYGTEDEITACPPRRKNIGSFEPLYSPAPRASLSETIPQNIWYEEEQSNRKIPLKASSSIKTLYYDWESPLEDFDKSASSSSSRMSDVAGLSTETHSLISFNWNCFSSLWNSSAPASERTHVIAQGKSLLSVSVLYGCLCLSRLMSLIGLQCAVAQISFGKDMAVFGVQKTFAKAGCLTYIYSFAVALPLLIDVLSSGISPAKARCYDRLTILITTILRPICLRFGLDTRELFASSHRTSEHRSARNFFRTSPILKTFRSPEGLMFFLPAVCEVCATWLLSLSVTVLPWGIWMSLASWSVAAQLLISGWVFRRPMYPCHRTAVALISTGCAILWVVCATFVNAANPQVVVPLSRGDSTTGTDATSGLRTGSITTDMIEYTRLQTYAYATGTRAFLAILGHTCRILGIVLQDVLQISTNIPSDQASKIHGAEVFCLAIVIVPLVSCFLPGADWHGSQESFRDAFTMVQYNWAILAWCSLMFASTSICHLLAVQLTNRLDMLHVTVAGLLEWTTTLVLSIFLGFCVLPSNTISCPILALLLAGIGSGLCFFGVLVSAGLVQIQWPPLPPQEQLRLTSIIDNTSESLRYTEPAKEQLSGYGAISVSTVLVFLYGGASHTTVDMNSSAEAEPFGSMRSDIAWKWSSFHHEGSHPTFYTEIPSPSSEKETLNL